MYTYTIRYIVAAGAPFQKNKNRELSDRCVIKDQNIIRTTHKYCAIKYTRYNRESCRVKMNRGTGKITGFILRRTHHRISLFFIGGFVLCDVCFLYSLLRYVI